MFYPPLCYLQTGVRLMRVLPLLLLAVLPVPGNAQERYAEAIHIGAVDSVWSAELDEHRPFLVYTPPSYDAPASTQRYPVLYVLDGNAHFHSVSGLVQILSTGVNGTYAIPEMIVVALPNTDRTRDLTPTRPATDFEGNPTPPEATSGGNEAFFSFLEDELIPHIESRFRTMPYRVFVGHSLGGITALNALYTMPETFDAYVAIDPSLWWDDRVLLRKAKDHFSTARLSGKVLYVAQANTVQPDATEPNQHFSAITQFDAVMRAYDQSGIRYAFRYYDDDDHGSVPLIAEYDALRFIFGDYRVPLQRIMAEPELLAKHFGEVSTALGTTFSPPEGMIGLLAQFALTQDTANALTFGEIRAELYPESARAHEFLGDLWAKRGEREKARQHYETALAHDPDNADLQAKLRR